MLNWYLHMAKGRKPFATALRRVKRRKFTIGESNEELLRDLPYCFLL